MAKKQEKIGLSETAAERPEESEASAIGTTEPWLSGSLGDVPPVSRGVLHALQLAKIDIERWCGNLTDEEINARPGGVEPVAFHLRHIARSLDRLLTYAEGSQLSARQFELLEAETAPDANSDQLFAELEQALTTSTERIRGIDAEQLEVARFVGRKRLPTTVGGLLVHCADHTQRHTGQAVTTAKILMAQRPGQAATTRGRAETSSGRRV